MADRTPDDRPIWMLAIDVAKSLTSEAVLERLSDLSVHRGGPEKPLE